MYIQYMYVHRGCIHVHVYTLTSEWKAMLSRWLKSWGSWKAIICENTARYSAQHRKESGRGGRGRVGKDILVGNTRT